jgi:hypothetical protein
MCVDENGMLWLHALMNKSEPPASKIGSSTCCRPDSQHVDPFAAPPADGSEAGPHAMIFDAGTAMAGYPNQAKQPIPLSRV